MRFPRTFLRHLLTAVAAASALALIGCSTPTADNGGGGIRSGPPTGELSGSLTIYAAASLATAFDALAADFTTEHPGVTVESLTFDGSSTLAAQLVEGASADIFGSADERNMAVVQEAGLITDEPEIFATNRLVIAVAPGNPLGIESLADLGEQGQRQANSHVAMGTSASRAAVGNADSHAAMGTSASRAAVGNADPPTETGTTGSHAKTANANSANSTETPLTIICAPEVPCGAASSRLLDRAQVTLTPASEEQNVAAVLTKVRIGEADAGLVYHSDVVAAEGEVDGVEIDGAAEDANRYPIARLKNSQAPDAAEAFIEFTLSPHGQTLLNELGFGAP